MKFKITINVDNMKWLGFGSTNVPTLGEGGDFNHKYQYGEQMLNIAVNVKRRTAPPLLPNVCYAFGFLKLN